MYNGRDHTPAGNSSWEAELHSRLGWNLRCEDDSPSPREGKCHCNSSVHIRLTTLEGVNLPWNNNRHSWNVLSYKFQVVNELITTLRNRYDYIHLTGENTEAGDTPPHPPKVTELDTVWCFYSLHYVASGSRPPGWHRNKVNLKCMPQKSDREEKSLPTLVSGRFYYKNKMKWVIKYVIVSIGIWTTMLIK